MSRAQGGVRPRTDVGSVALQAEKYARSASQAVKNRKSVSWNRESHVFVSNKLERAYQQLAQELFRSKPALRRSFPGKAEVDAVIFDSDGTLLNSLWAWENSGPNFLRSIGIEPTEGLQAELVPLSLSAGARLIKERYQLSQSPHQILEATLAPIRQRYYHEIEPMPGIPELLVRLKGQGVKLAIATASDRALTVAALKRLGLLEYFDEIVTCDEVGIGKTSPAVYEEARARLGTAKERTLVAEDALHALQTAHKAGFPTAAVAESHSASQTSQKAEIADYYVISFRGENVIAK